MRTLLELVLADQVLVPSPLQIIDKLDPVTEPFAYVRLLGDRKAVDKLTKTQDYKKKYPEMAAEVDQWEDATFLNKARVCLGGKVTRTAIILLGRNEAEHFLSPGIAHITWVLMDEKGDAKEYQHFGPPLIRAVDGVFARVRNVTYRYLAAATLFPNEVTQYDSWVLRETLHDCIAHQDYALAGRDARSFPSLHLPLLELSWANGSPPEFWQCISSTRNQHLQLATDNCSRV